MNNLETEQRLGLLGMEERVVWSAAVSLLSLRQVAALLFTCEFPFHFKRMEKSRNGQTENSHSR